MQECRTFLFIAMHTISPGEHLPQMINVIVEIPKGSQNKYEFDHENNVIKLDRVLFSPLYYPGDYGFVPNTLEEDGDPLDVLVLVTYPTFPGVLIEARPIGILEMVDNGEPDSKVLCVPVNDIRYSEVKDLSGVPKPILNEIAHFFQVYKELEGKKVEVKGWNDVAAAHKSILGAVERFKK